MAKPRKPRKAKVAMPIPLKGEAATDAPDHIDQMIERELRKPGRPSKYTPELGERIAELLADGKTLTSICKADDMPHARTVRRWALDEKHPFCPLYARGRELGYLAMADELRDDADKASEEPGAVARDRLRVDTKKWFLSKVLPKIYGDKLALSDQDGGVLKIKLVA